MPHEIFKKKEFCNFKSLQSESQAPKLMPHSQ